MNKNNITLMSISGNENYLDKTIKAAEFSNRKHRFKTKILSNKEFNHPFIECILIDSINSISEYNSFCLDKMVDYFDTTHVLIFQSDGFVLDSDRWDDNFLNYDYIGAPWPLWFKDVNIDNCVGNGGFCIRSKKLLNLIKTYRLSDKDNETPEDVFICRKYRSVLENSGIIWSPIEVASQFSIEHQHSKNMNDQSNHNFINTFGFHAKAKISEYMKLIT